MFIEYHVANTLTQVFVEWSEINNLEIYTIVWRENKFVLFLSIY